MTEHRPYIELHCHSNFSLLDGASHPETLVERAAELGMPALALTDHDAVYGVVRFAKAAQEHGIKPIFGAEMMLTNGHHLTLLVQNNAGWSNLCQLITLARMNSPKGEAALPFETLAGHTDGLIALSGCRKGEIPAALLHGDNESAMQAAKRYLALFPSDCFYVELQQHHLPSDRALVANLAQLAQQIGLQTVATNNVHYATPDGHRLQDVLTCIRHNTTLDESEYLLRPNSEYYLKSADKMTRLFGRYPDAVTNTQRVAESCDFELIFGLQSLPEYPTPGGQSAHDYLTALCGEGLDYRQIEPTWNVTHQLQHELEIIARSGLSNYFLIVWDIVRYATAHGIMCQGRGSAANSLVAYLLGISPVNPLEHNLVFERFLSDERQSVPDIDIDFDAARREEVIQYVYKRYGHAHAAMACTFVTFRARSALRDIGKVLGLPLDLLDRASRTIDTFKSGRIAESDGLRETIQGDSTWAYLTDLCTQIDGFPRHLGIHNGGMVIMGAPLAQRLSTEPATMPDRYVVQWDKDSLEDAGLVKIDILGLRMISAIAEARVIIQQTQDVTPDFDRMTFDDPAVFEMVSRADTIGVFQVESRAQQQVLPRLQPKSFNDIVVSISLIRPGPVQGNMVHPYLRRRLGQEPVAYPHPLLQPALEETLGVVLFQEQVLKVARDLAGFTGGQGEQLRRALGSKRGTEALERFHSDFLDGAQAKGVEATVASAVFDTLRAFGGYSFPKSHAASFAKLVYESAWLKRYYPAALYVGLLNNQPMGFWSPAVIVNDAKRHGVNVLPVDVNLSGAKCQLENGAVRLGYNYVKGFGDAAIQQVMTARASVPFASLRDFAKRTQLPRRLIEHLILAGGMDGWGKSRRTLVWELGKVDYDTGKFDLIYEDEPTTFPDISALEAMGVEYALLGMSLRLHPVALYRDQLNERGILSSEMLERRRDGEQVRIAGLIVVHQAPPTAKGHHFVTLEDEYGFVNVIVRPDIYPRYRRMLRESPLVTVSGIVQHQSSVINVRAQQIRPLTS